MKVIDQTKIYDGQLHLNFIKSLIDYVSSSDLENVKVINIYDSCPERYPVIAQGAYWLPDSTDDGAVDIYLDQCFGHMLTYHNKRGIIQKISDLIFVFLFGRKHLTDTLFHEIGHLVYEKNVKKVKKDESERFAKEYALILYYEVYPIQKKLNRLTNKIYKWVYYRRIEHDNNKRKIPITNSSSGNRKQRGFR